MTMRLKMFAGTLLALAIFNCLVGLVRLADKLYFQRAKWYY